MIHAHLIRQRLTAGQIARELGVDRATVVTLIARLGISPIATHALEYDGDDLAQISAAMNTATKGKRTSVASLLKNRLET